MLRLMAFSLVFCSVSVAWPQSTETNGTISVRGEGIVTAAPDVFFLDVAVTLQDPDLNKIQTEVAKRCGQIVKAARQFKLDPARTFTQDYRISPRRDNAQKFLGYLVTQGFRFALSDLNQAEALTTAVLNAGATNIESIEFTVADSEELWEAAREKAVTHALLRATRMTKPVGSKPGLARTINDQGNQLVIAGCSWNPADRNQTTADGQGLPDGDRVFFVPPTAVKFQVFVQASFAIEPL
jgi:uncharacterized protein YggE